MSGKDEKVEMMEKALPHFTESLKNTFSMMVFLEAECGEAVVCSDEFPFGDVSASIGLIGEELCGSASLIFSKDVAEQVCRSMLMMGEGDEVTEDDIKDSIGELANMLAGGAKTSLSEGGASFNIGLPSIGVGKDHRLGMPTGTFSKVVPVKLDKGAFHITLSIA